MAKGETKNTKKSTDIYDTNDRYNNTVVKETITMDNSPIFNKILVCLYIIIALLAINIVVTAIKGSNLREYSTTSSSDNQNGEGQNNNGEEPATYDVSSFTAIDVDKMVEAFDNEDYTLLYLGRPNCGFCVKFVPVLTEVQKNYNFTTLYLDINTVKSEDDYNRIIDLDEEFFTNEEDKTAYGFTPMTLIVKEGEIVDYIVGHVEYSKLEEMVKKYFDKK